ncbi:MAG: RNase H family protein, partial [Thermodesulfobacteriota bacterium]
MREPYRDPEIFQRLSEGLPDNLLRDLFPDREPQSIRDLLRGVSGKITPVAGDGAEAPPLPLARPAVSAASPRREFNENCFLYTDGASRGNPGEAGAGAVLLDGDRRQLATRAIYLGRCTNNVAEYRALLAGLEMALENGCEKLT